MLNFARFLEGLTAKNLHVNKVEKGGKFMFSLKVNLWIWILKSKLDKNIIFSYSVHYTECQHLVLSSFHQWNVTNKKLAMFLTIMWL